MFPCWWKVQKKHFQNIFLRDISYLSISRLIFFLMILNIEVIKKNSFLFRAWNPKSITSFCMSFSLSIIYFSCWCSAFILETCSIMNGINAPKVVECLGSDGNRYRQLAKSGNDDLRQDAVWIQITSSSCGSYFAFKMMISNKILWLGIWWFWGIKFLTAELIYCCAYSSGESRSYSFDEIWFSVEPVSLCSQTTL